MTESTNSKHEVVSDKEIIAFRMGHTMRQYSPDMQKAFLFMTKWLQHNGYDVDSNLWFLRSLMIELENRYKRK